jgi:cell filamentation protein
MSQAVDPYWYLGTTVLINSGGFRTQAELDQFEADAVMLSLASLRIRPIVGSFDEARLRETHRRLFRLVYSWAGQLRQQTGTLTKTRESGQVVRYGHSDHVPTALSKILSDLQRENALR